MPYTIVNEFEGGTREQYDATVEIVHWRLRLPKSAEGNRIRARRHPLGAMPSDQIVRKPLRVREQPKRTLDQRLALRFPRP
jgi:hypothetical protein